LGNTEDVNIPTRNESLQNIVMISAGYAFGLALDSLGNIWSFGCNNCGNLGLGDTIERHQPCPVAVLSNIAQVSAGFHHSLIVDSHAQVS
jgi:alpha-tubulin suppressor-like RCC1 family protein